MSQMPIKRPPSSIHDSSLARPVAPLALWPDEQPTSNGLDMRQIVLLLQRRRKILGLTFGAIAALTLAWMLLSPPVYQATATLQLNTSVRESNDNTLPAISDLSGVNQLRSLGTQTEILKTPVLQRQALKSLPADLRGHVDEQASKIEPIPETDLIAVSASSGNPQAAAALANAICASYIRLSREKNQAQLGGAADYVKEQLTQADKRLNAARTKLKSYKEQQGTFDLNAESQRLIEQISSIENEWRLARTQKEGGWARLEQLKAQVDKMSPNEITSREIVRRPGVELMKTQLSQLELDRINAQGSFQPGSTKMRNLDSQIAALRAQLKSGSQTEVGTMQQQTNPVRQTVLQDIAKQQGEVWALEAQGVALKAAWKQAKAQLARLPEREQRLGQMNTNLASLQQNYDLLNQKHQNLRATEGARVANASVLFPAETPTVPAGARKMRILLVGLVLGLIAACLLALWTDRSDERVYSDVAVQSASGLKVLTPIPVIEESWQRALHGDSGYLPPLLENYQMLRTNIAFAGDKPIRSLVITSSLAGEGKSLSSVHLAAASALSGERVILVDCDLRNPSIHQLCSLPNQLGFADVINGSCSLNEALQETRIPGLRVLTAGTATANPLKFLKSAAADACLAQIAAQSDLVIIDTPPALGLADAHVAAARADAVLLVVSQANSRRQEIAHTSHLLAQTGAALIGVLFNKAENVTGSYYCNQPYYAVAPTAIVPEKKAHFIPAATENVT